MRAVLPDHLIGLPGGAWAAWRWVGLRSAGFPADDVLRLGFPCCAAAADDLAALETALEAERTNALAVVQKAFEAARARDDAASVRGLSALRRHLKAGRLPAPTADPAIDATLCALRQVAAAVTAARRRFDELFCAARDAASEIVRATAALPRFREAVAWQNPPVLMTCIAPLQRSAAGARSSKHRRRETRIASYLHRYCVKNETIGFFGPVGWARFVDRGGALEVEPGEELLRRREVYFEQWAIDVVADRLSAVDALKPWMAPRPTPVARVTGLTVHLPFQRAIALTGEELAVFSACDGRSTAQELADRLGRAGSGPGLSRERIVAVLDALVEKQLVSLRFDLPYDAHPERRLRELLERIGDGRLRRAAMALVARLEAARAAVAEAAGNPERLYDALSELGTQFTALTGASPSRSAGQMYWGRTLVFEDCERDVSARIGRPLLAALGPPLSLVLASARWLTYEIGRHCRTMFSGLFERLRRSTGSGSVGFVEFFHHASELLSKDTAFSGFAMELRRRWAMVLLPPAAAKSVHYTSDGLRTRVAEVFDAPAPGWAGACYHSPDLMIVGRDLEAINAEDFQLVLGELHVGVNTLRGRFFIEQHPDAGDIFRGIEADLPGLRLAPITPKRYARRATRNFPVLTANGQYFTAITLDSVPPPDAACVAGGSLEILEVGGDLIVATNDGTLQFDLLQSFAGILAQIVVSSFAIMLPTRHSPRLSIDRLIVARETWRFAGSEIDFAHAKASADRFLAARRWRARHGMPRWVFVRIPGEHKPVYLDFDSPIAVDIVARRIRNSPASAPGSGHIAISEMVPSHGEHWLTDAEGKRYCCELRVVAVDRGGPDAPRRN